MAEALDVGDQLLYMMMHINELHYSFLNAHESMRKLDEKSRLEGLIKNYLTIAPHEKKFCYRETGLILHRSAECKENFSGYRASTAWTAIQTYAHNLLAQSWRKEFKEIKTYSGFFKHDVESGLLGSELMFTLMGYRVIGKGTLVLDGPVDPDRVANVSRDSLIALVECQIMCTIYAELIKNGCCCTWLDILEFRESHACSPEQALHSLLCHFKQRYQSTYIPKCNLPEGEPYYQYYYKTSGRHFSDQDIFHEEPTDEGRSVFKVNSPMKRCTACQKDHNNMLVPKASSSAAVPTGQLIELGPSYSFPPSESYFPEMNASRSRNCDNPDLRDPSTNSTDRLSLSNPKFKSNREMAWEEWRYSNQTSESKKPFKHFPDKKITVDELDDAMKSMKIGEPKLLCTGIGVRNEGKRPDKFPNSKIHSKKAKKIDSSISAQTSVQTLGREPIKRLDPNFLTLRVKLSDKWACSACTFHNSVEKDVCEICSKSRTSGNESQPLTSGGRQCPQCTLVNEKGVTICDACGGNLKDSPTYI